MKKTFRKTSAILCAITVVASFMSLSGFVANADGEPTSDYTLTIPATLAVESSGWNSLEGGISAKDTLESGKKLVVTAESENSWNLVANKGEETESKVGYNLATTGDANSKYSATAEQTAKKAEAKATVAEEAQKAAEKAQVEAEAAEKQAIADKEKAESDLNDANKTIETLKKELEEALEKIKNPETPDDPETGIIGDANQDNKLNIMDASFIAKKLAQKKSDELPEIADFNKDGNKNVLDARAIASYLANRKSGDNENSATTAPDENQNDTSVTTVATAID